MSAKAVSLILACVAGVAFLPGADPKEPAAASLMTIDPVHSSVMFRIKHLDCSYFYGTFRKMSGELNIDEKNPASSSITFEIDAESIDTRDPKRDDHLRSQEFFSVKEFPKITFKSKSLAKKGEDFEVAGDLTMHGVTKPLTVTIKPTGSIDDPKMGKKAGFETNFAIKRSDFGMSYGVDKKALGDEVAVMLSVEAAVKK